VSLERFHDQVQLDGPEHRRESKGGQQRAGQDRRAFVARQAVTPL